MAKTTKHLQPSKETQEEAIKIARGIQQPGQTKEQTKLIAQGIQKGIQLYKKQCKAKAREWDRQAKKTRHQVGEAHVATKQIVHYKQHWLPWVLLALTWIGLGVSMLFLKCVFN